MPSGSKRPSRPADRGAVRIERHYSQVILSGQLPSGTQLPPSNEIAKTWSVSATAVQKAMRQLAAAGLVERQRKSGTIVRSLNHRAMVGLIVGPSLADETTHFYRAMVTALEPLLNQRALICRVYDGVHSMSLPASGNYRPIDILKTDQVYHQFKGLILIMPEIPGLPEIDASPLPKATLHWNMEHSDTGRDFSAFTRDVLERIAKRGHRKVLVISTMVKSNKVSHPLTAAQIQFSKADIPPGISIEHLPIQIVEKGWHAEKLVFDSLLNLIPEWKANPDKKPQTIVIIDDLYARGACMALLKSQIDVPGEIEIIVQATKSIEHHYGMPVQRYEFSCDEEAMHLESILWKRITGEPLPPLPVMIRGRFRTGV